MTPGALAKSGIEALNVENSSAWYRCLSCGHAWQPPVLHGGRYPRGWWKCPEGCNE
jgi:hypothetical protein